VLLGMSEGKPAGKGGVCMKTAMVRSLPVRSSSKGLGGGKLPIAVAGCNGVFPVSLLPHCPTMDLNAFSGQRVVACGCVNRVVGSG